MYNDIKEHYTQCVKLNKSITYNENVVIDGVERFWNTTILPVRDKKSGVVKIFGISREFTQLKKAEKELQRLNETLEAKVKERTEELSKSLEEIKKIAVTDALTGLYNRNKIDESLNYAIKYFKRYKKEFTVILLDIDYFKDVNDTYGHLVGDAVLIEFADILIANTRDTDLVGRWGGEEFLIICPKTNIDEVDILAQNLKTKIEAFEFSKMKNITASFGLTAFREEDSIEDVIKRVDKALYSSKSNGRNCITKV